MYMHTRHLSGHTQVAREEGGKATTTNRKHTTMNKREREATGREGFMKRLVALVTAKGRAAIRDEHTRALSPLLPITGTS